MASVISMTDADNITMTFDISSFQLGLNYTAKYGVVYGDRPVERVVNGQRVFSNIAWNFSFVHDADGNAVILEKMLNTTFDVQLAMSEDENAVGEFNYINMNFSAVLTGLVTKPIGLWASGGTSTSHTIQAIGQIVTMQIVYNKSCTISADVPDKTAKGKIKKKETRAVIFYDK